MDKEKIFGEYNKIPKNMKYLDFERVYDAYFFKEVNSGKEWSGIPYSVKNYNELIYRARDLNTSEYETSELRDIINGALFVSSSGLSVGCLSCFSSALPDERPFVMLGLMGGIAGMATTSFNIVKKHLINADRGFQKEYISENLEDYDWVIKQAQFWEDIVDSGKRLGYVRNPGDERKIEGLASNNHLANVIINNSQNAMFMKDYLEDWLKEIRKVN